MTSKSPVVHSKSRMKRIATLKGDAVPKDAPERIYLQHDPEKDGGPFSEAHEVTWCCDKINDNDIEYVRTDLVTLARGKTR